MNTIYKTGENPFVISLPLKKTTEYLFPKDLKVGFGAERTETKKTNPDINLRPINFLGYTAETAKNREETRKIENLTNQIKIYTKPTDGSKLNTTI